MRPTRPFAAALRLGAWLPAALLATACTGGTPWGATPQRIEIPVPDLSKVPQVFDGASGSTQGALRVAERVRGALAAQPSLAGLGLQVEGLEGGVMVLSGEVPSAGDRQLAVQTARQVAGVSNVVDRLRGP